MPLFVCTTCECVENTALCHYWTLIRDKKPALCSACDPEIKAWHGKFPQAKPTAKDIDEADGGISAGWVAPYPKPPKKTGRP